MGQVLTFPFLLSVKVNAVVNYELNINECSYCYLRRVIRNASIEGRLITTTRSRRNRRRAKGFDVRINGRKLYWMNTIPTECECEPR